MTITNDSRSGACATGCSLDHRVTAAIVAIALWRALSAPVQAATIDLEPGGSFESAAESLAPGDTLIVHAGTYVDSGRIAITVKGAATQPVVIRAAEGEARPVIARRSTDPVQNTIDIVGATYLTLSGLEITGNSGDGGDGVNMSGEPSFITLENLTIHGISVGINFRSSMHDITARGNEIYDTHDTGEGMYIGCHEGDCVVRDSLIEGNWIHDTRAAEQGDGIEIKKASHSNIVRDNVIHDTNYPCIIVYGTGGQPQNIIERNVMWNCDDTGIQAAADAVIRNNIILQTTGGGFTSQDHNGVTPNNLQFINNTIVGGDPCLRLNSWSGKTDMVFANNAVYCPTDNFVISGLTGVSASGNVLAPAPPGFSAAAFTLGRSVDLDFLGASLRNVYPSEDSALRSAADSTLAPDDDFNGAARTSPADAGAYAWTGATNPGWAVTEGFKSLPASGPAAPEVDLQADPTTVDQDGSTTLSWTSSNAANCTASGDWAGNKSTSGSESSGPLTADSTFTLECSNAEGARASDTVNVTVNAQTPEPPPSPDPPEEPSPPPEPTPPPAPTPTPAPGAGNSSGGGGSFDLTLLLALLLTSALKVQGDRLVSENSSG